jgi:hypothetical protein
MRFVEKNFWDRVVRRADGCWDWTGFIDNKGYGRVNAWIGDRRRSQGAHRVSWFVHFGDIPDGLHVLHNCDNPICTRPDHLRLGTHQENMLDRKRRPRPSPLCGEGNKSAKFTWDLVRRLRAQYKANPHLNKAALARAHGVTPTAMCFMLNGKTWTDNSAEHAIAHRGQRVTG